MGTVLSSRLRTKTSHPEEPRPSARWPRGDVWAVAILIALPVLIFGAPALLGHAVLPGDDLTQNFPLRVLAGQEIRSGELPLYNPYIWSGAPLLAGWNAGAAYPLTFLFAVLPATAAWTVNMIMTWAVAGLGMFCFLRALRLTSLPSLLGALSFAFAGAMSAQVSHFGLVAGMSWVPVALLSVLRLSETRTMASRLRWTGVLAGATGLVILAGEPRAVDDACVIVFIYAVWRVARLGRRWAPAAVSVAAGAALGACLGAVQLLPGLAAVATSQRAASSMALFNSGSLPAKWLLLMLVPDLLGGSGSFSQPSFLASYNLTEVTDYVGILPLIAAAVLLGRVRLRRRPPEWLVWHVIALVGVLLALGGRTPLGHVLIHLPLFGDQRLQSRNVLVTDLALAVLLAYWANHPLGEKSRRFLRVRIVRRLDLETVLGVLPPLAMIAVVVIGLCWGTGLLRWLGVGLAATQADGRLKPWLVPYALIGAAAITFVIFGRRLRPRLRLRVLAAFVLIDLIIFTVLGVVAVDAGLGRGGSASDHTKTAGDILSGQTTELATADASGARPVASLGFGGRFAIYDPNEIDGRQLTTLGTPDLNDIGGAPSIQGYSSIVDGRYASATGSHQATGEGQDELSPQAVASGILGQLDTSVLLTVPAYLITSAGSTAVPGPPGTGERQIAAHGQATWYFGTSLEVARLDVPDADARQTAAAGIRIGLVAPGGATRWFPARAASASVLTIDLTRPVTAVALIGQAGAAPSRLGAPSVTEPGGSVFVADGQLQNALTAPQWGLAGHDGSFAVFVDHFARGMFSLEALPGRSTSGATLWQANDASGTDADGGSAAVAVRSPHGVRVIRSVAAIPGWSATWHPQAGPATKLDVGRSGLVQVVDVPPGQGILTWTYVSPGFRAGFALSAAAVALLLLLLAAARWSRLKISRRERIPADGVLAEPPPAEAAGVS